jgi:acyl-CoA-binding protein
MDNIWSPFLFFPVLPAKKRIMELKEQFEKATRESKELPSKPDNETLLQLYSLYKQGTEGDVNTDPPSNPFDFVNKAKHEAWTNLKGKTREEAMQEYVKLVERLKG